MILKKIINKLELKSNKINWGLIEWDNIKNYEIFFLLCLIDKDKIPLEKIQKNILLYALKHPELEEFIKYKYKDIEKLINTENIYNYIIQNPNINIIKYCLNINIKKHLWELSYNNNALELIINNINDNNISWEGLSNNENALDILDNNFNNINWDKLANINNSKIINIFKKHYQLVKWSNINNITNLYKYSLTEKELDEYNINRAYEGKEIIKIIDKKIYNLEDKIENNFIFLDNNINVVNNKIKKLILIENSKFKIIYYNIIFFYIIIFYLIIFKI